MDNLELHNKVHKNYYEDGLTVRHIKTLYKLQTNQLKSILRERHPIMAQIFDMRQYQHNMNRRKFRLRMGYESEEDRPHRWEREAAIREGNTKWGEM